MRIATAISLSLSIKEVATERRSVSLVWLDLAATAGFVSTSFVRFSTVHSVVTMPLESWL